MDEPLTCHRTQMGSNWEISQLPAILSRVTRTDEAVSVRGGIAQGEGLVDD
jgi:hypothetical protein